MKTVRTAALQLLTLALVGSAHAEINVDRAGQQGSTAPAQLQDQKTCEAMGYSWAAEGYCETSASATDPSQEAPIDWSAFDGAGQQLSTYLRARAANPAAQATLPKEAAGISARAQKALASLKKAPAPKDARAGGTHAKAIATWTDLKAYADSFTLKAAQVHINKADALRKH